MRGDDGIRVILFLFKSLGNHGNGGKADDGDQAFWPVTIETSFGRALESLTPFTPADVVDPIGQQITIKRLIFDIEISLHIKTAMRNGYKIFAQVMYLR